jgi:hypothetical protein
LSQADALSPRALNRATLAKQLLLERSDLSPLAALERVGGLQAQWPKPPFVGLWTRLANFERDQLSSLLRRRTAVRATMMRGTIHIVSTKDYLATRAALQPALFRGLAALRGKSENLDIPRVLDAARELLHQPRTFEEVRDGLVAEFPKANERAMGYVARMMLQLVMVPTDGPWAFPATARFQLAESWLGKPVSSSEDPSALLLRYFKAFGPATVADAQAWTGLQGLRPIVASLGAKLRTFRDERRRELFDVADAPHPDPDTPAPIRFLQEFDNVLMGYQDRSRVLDAKHKSFVLLPGLRVAATVLVDGLIAATWKVERSKKRATIAVQLFAKTSKATTKDIAAEAHRVVAFLEPDSDDYDVRFV